jgi:hypothetical protein
VNFLGFWTVRDRHIFSFKENVSNVVDKVYDLLNGAICYQRSFTIKSLFTYLSLRVDRKQGELSEQRSDKNTDISPPPTRAHTNTSVLLAFLSNQMAVGLISELIQETVVLPSEASCVVLADQS